ncbi:MAG: hypothetical protein AB1567_11035 [bacterium]
MQKKSLNMGIPALIATYRSRWRANSHTEKNARSTTCGQKAYMPSLSNGRKKEKLWHF